MSRRAARAEGRRERVARRPPAKPSPRSIPWSAWGVPALIVLAGLYAYHDSYGGPFIFDDQQAIQRNYTIRRLSWAVLWPPGHCAVNGRPIANLSLALNYAINGLNVGSYHGFNVIIHVLAALVLFGIVRRTLALPNLRARYGEEATWLALAVALLWVVHPLLSESVTYVIQRTESLMGLFYLLAVYCLVRSVDSRRPGVWYAGVVGAFALGMGCKEIMITAPVILLAYDRLILAPSFREVFRRRGRLYASIGILLLVLVAVAGTRVRTGLPHLLSNHLRRWDYAQTQTGVIVHYLRLSVWPHPLAADYDDWPIAESLVSVLPSAVAVVALLGVTLWALTRWPYLAFLGVWFFVILAPTSSVLPLSNEVAAERRMYLPLAAVITLVVVAGHAVLGRLFPGAAGAPRRRLAGGLVVVAIAATFATLTVRRNQVYSSTTAFWSAVLEARPNSGRAHVNLGDYLFKNGKPDQAFPHFEQAVRLKPDDPTSHYGLGVTLQHRGRVDEAREQYLVTLRLDPRNFSAHNNLGNLLAQEGRLEEAVEHYTAALEINPKHAHAHFNLAVVLDRQGRTDEAVQHFAEALRLDPSLTKARRALENAQRAGATTAN